MEGKGWMDLAQLCREKLASDPFSGCVFIFRSRSAKSIRLLVYDGQGFYLVQKRLSKGTVSLVAERRRSRTIGGSLSSAVVAGRRRSGHQSRPNVAKSELILAAKKMRQRACVQTDFLSHCCCAGRMAISRT